MSTPVRLGIFGSYNASSQGDLAILAGMLTQIEEHFPAAEVTVFAFDPAFIQAALTPRYPFLRAVAARPGLPSTASERPHARPAAASPHPQATRGITRVLQTWPWMHDGALVARYNHFWRQQLRRLRSLDLLLIGGGGLLVDLYAKWPIYPLLYVLLARRARIPVMFYAVGVGPIATWRGKFYFSLALNLSQGVTVRDRRSLAQARKLLFQPEGKLQLAADPAFALRNAVQPTAHAPSSARGRRNHPQIGLTTAALYRPGNWPIADPRRYHRYVRHMADLVASLTNRLAAKVVLFATNCPQDLHTAKDILRQARPQILRGEATLFSPCTLSDISSLLSTLDLVIGTRLHSLILALVHEVPALGLAYQDKVTALYEELQMPELVFPIQPFLGTDEEAFASLLDDLLAQTQALLDHPAVYSERFAPRVHALRDAAQKSILMAANLIAKAPSKSFRA